MIVMPRSWASCVIRPRISATPAGSRPLVGSSSSSSSGSEIRAIAIPRRCFIPREYWRAFFLAASVSPTMWRVLSTDSRSQDR